MPGERCGSETTKALLTVEALRAGQSVRFKVLGTSMVPSLWPEDVVAVHSARTTPVCMGDIVVVARDNRFFVHRLISLCNTSTGPSVITRGDAMDAPDPPAHEAEILGKVSSIFRHGRVLVPQQRRSWSNRVGAGLLGRSARILNLMLRARQFTSTGVNAVDFSQAAAPGDNFVP